NSKSAGISESDLMGMGKRLEMLYEEDENRKSLESVWDDNRVFGTSNRFLAGCFDRNDGQRNLFYFGRPFRSLAEKKSWFISSDNSNTIGRLFEFGDERYIFRQKHNEFISGYTFAHGE